MDNILPLLQRLPFNSPTFSFVKFVLIIILAPKWKDHLRDQRLPDSAPISTVDRFADSSQRNSTLTGLGTSSNIADPQFDTIMSATEVESAMRRLGTEYKWFLLNNAPHTSYWGHQTPIAYLSPVPRIHIARPQDSESPFEAFLTTGFHGRERGGPDSLIYFIADLLYARDHNRGLTYGNVTYTKEQVSRVTKKGVLFMPMANPDGLRWDQRYHNCWGNNLNFTNQKQNPGSLGGIGVNIDRNFDIAWDYRRIFSPSVPDVASDNPSHELYHGREPFSEAESRNVAWVFEKHPGIRWYMNVGAKSRVISHPWAIDTTQTTDPEQNWRNKVFDGKRGDADLAYGEYMNKMDLDLFHRISDDMVAQIQKVQGKPFRDVDDALTQTQPPLAASGTATDWAYSRHLVNSGEQKVYSFKMQYGLSDEEANVIALKGGCPYYPTSEQYKSGLIEAAVGYMEFLLATEGARPKE